MEEEDWTQGFSIEDFDLESEQPGMKRSKDSNKDGKKRKPSAQDTGSESGKASPQVRVHHGADGFTVNITPVQTGQEDFDLIHEAPAQAAASSSPKDHSKGKGPAAQKAAASSSPKDHSKGKVPAAQKAAASSSPKDHSKGKGPAAQKAAASSSPKDHSKGKGPAAQKAAAPSSSKDHSKGKGPAAQRAAASSSPKDHIKGKGPAARKPPAKTISYATVSGSSQSVITGRPRSSIPQKKLKASKPVRKTKSSRHPGKAKTSRSSPIVVSAEVHQKVASEEAADEEEWVEEEELVEEEEFEEEEFEEEEFEEEEYEEEDFEEEDFEEEDFGEEEFVEEEFVEYEELSSQESQSSEGEEPSEEAPPSMVRRMDSLGKRLSGYETSLKEIKDLVLDFTQSKKRKAERKDRGREKRRKTRKDNSRRNKKAWEDARAAEVAEAAEAAKEEAAARLRDKRARKARKKARKPRRAERAHERSSRTADRGGPSGRSLRRARTRPPVVDEEPLLSRMSNMEQELRILKTPPAVQAPSFGDEVRQDPKTLQGLFEKLRPFLPEKIKPVTVTSAHTTTRVLKYFFNFSDSDGYWSSPKPLKNGKDKFGYFKVLRAPTINKGWVFSSLPVETVEQGVETAEDPERQVKLTDKLQKSQPVECVDEEFNAFFAAASLTETKPNVSGCSNSTRFLTLEPDVFRNVEFVKFEGHTLLPSLELKNRKAALSCLPVVDLLKQMNLRSKSILENWDKPLAWDSVVGLLDPSEESSEDSPILPLSDSITKEELRDELRLRTWGAESAISLLDHATKVLIAQHAELKLMLRSLFMEKVKQGANQRLSQALVNSRLSSPGLFGNIPESYSLKLENGHHEFPSFEAPDYVGFSGPAHARKKFQNTPSGSRGVSSNGRGKKRHPTNKNWTRGEESQFLSSEKIQQAKGYATTSRGSTRGTRGKHSTRGSNSRGGRGARGRGGKKKFS